jgi:HPt (histidine-containing phosphotransfer) domain-containing protein
VARWLAARMPRSEAPLPAPPVPAEGTAPPGFIAMGGDPAVIDLTILAKLLGWDQDKVRKFAFKFLQSTQDGFAEIDRALAAGDIDRIRELGHRIKSAARTVGALGLANLCERLEKMPPAPAAEEQAEAAGIASQLWPLLELITEHIMKNTTFANDH